MIRAVLDTNILASGAVASGGTLAEIIDAWQNGEFVVLTSPVILAELERALRKPYFTQRLDQATINGYLALVRSRTIIVQITVSVRGVASHPEDDLILGTAVSGQADYLVTGDAQLQRLAAYRGVVILNPRAFLDVLTSPDLR